MNAIHRGGGVARAYFQHCLQALSTSLLSLTTKRVNGNALPQTAHGTSVSLSAAAIDLSRRGGAAVARRDLSSEVDDIVAGSTARGAVAASKGIHNAQD